MKERSNIILIGMPGSGKSTTGVILAKRMAFGFLDTDLMIELAQHAPLEKILEQHGYLGLRAIEEQILLGLECRHHVIATGGSAVYSPKALQHLAANGVVIYLEAPFEDLTARVGDMNRRGVARAPQQSFRDVFDERTPLYNTAAEITVSTRFKSQDRIAEEIEGILKFAGAD